MATGKLAKRYNPLHVLGEGAMGQVWLVEDTLLGDRLAMKIISRQLATREKSLLQFRQEFHLMTQLRHPNCCEVFDYGTLPDGSPYFTMEHVPGQSLAELLPMEPDRIREVLSQLLMALGHLHRLELVHRDIKSENVRIRPDGVVKLMDYGLMEYAGRAGGGLTGTFPYLPPEVVMQGPVDQRSDLYSIGVLTYEMLTGRLPFRQEKPMDVLKAHVSERPERPSRIKPDCDRALEAVVMKLLEKNPVDRFQTAYEPLAALGVEVPAGIGGHLLSSPLVGHEPERAILAAQVAAIARGEPAETVMLTGASGLGKSRLAREYRYTAQLENIPCALATCREHGQSPYDAVVGALRSLLPAIKEHVRADLDRLAPVLVKLLPELAVPAMPDLDPPSSEKARLQAAIAELLLGLARQRPYVMILEDAQWADALSIEVFQHFRRPATELPIGILVTSREASEMARRGTGRLSHMPLGPLSRAEIARMAGAMLGTSQVEDGFLEQVERFSQGNPLFVERLLEHLVQEHILVNDGGWNTDVDLTPERLPATLHALLLTRVTSLPEEARTLTRVVAVVGRPAGIDLLKHVAGFSDQRLFGALEVLLLHHVLVQTELGDYGFAQDQFQAVVYGALEGGERLALHKGVAAALEHQIAGKALSDVPMDVIMAIATHHMLASDTGKTIRYALEAGMRNVSLFAHAIAERFLRAGYEVLLTVDGPEWDAERLAYLRYLGDLSRQISHFEEARDYYLQAIPLAEARRELALAGRMGTSLAKAFHALGQSQEAQEWARRSQNTCQTAGDPTGAARAHMTSARFTMHLGEIASSMGHTLRALELARSAGDRGQTGQALAYLGYLRIAHQAGTAAEGLEAMGEALALLEECGDKVELLYALLISGDSHFALGDYVAAQDTYTHALKLAEDLDLEADRCGALLNLANVGLEQGRFFAAAVAAAEAEVIASTRQDRFLEGVTAALASAGRRALGDFGPAREGLARARRFSEEVNQAYMAVLVGQIELETALDWGRFQRAADIGEGLARRLASAGNHEQEMRLNATLAFVHGRLGHLAPATAAADRAIAAAEAGQ
ncbi:MAG: Serine/threonine protein kinase, partial [Cyanobacteria bacterium RYN_339]|nr:Serine/threonine protein kinase [Cyanobacteria bacterium RYN_339]